MAKEKLVFLFEGQGYWEDSDEEAWSITVYRKCKNDLQIGFRKIGRTFVYIFECEDGKFRGFAR